MQRNNSKFISSHEDLEVYQLAFDAAEDGDSSSFISTGRGGLPPNPYDCWVTGNAL